MLIETKILDTFGITVTEYKLLVAVQENETMSSKNSIGSVRYYCNLPKSKLASLIGVKNKIYLFEMIPALVKKNLLAKDSSPARKMNIHKFLRTTDSWKQARIYYQV